MMFMGKEVESVYEGKRNSCCCGCSGTHSHGPERIAEVVALIAKHPDKQDACPGFVSIELGHRLYIAYFVPQEVQS